MIRSAGTLNRLGRRPLNRRGLTLIELLVVILIIAVLIAILVPAIMGAVQKAQEGAVVGEFSQISQAMGSFKDRFGDYPPSRILLDETGNYYQYASNLNPVSTLSTTDITYAQLATRSLTYLQKFWPRMALLGPGDGAGGYYYDFNGNNKFDPPYILQGYECLVFFLGGTPSQTIDPNGVLQWGVTGFGKNPVNPFPYLGTNATAQATALVLANHDQPFYEFKPGRLLDFDGNGYPGYIDSLDTTVNGGRYIAYFSAYGNNGYDPNDNNVNSGPDLTDDNANYAGVPVTRLFSCNYAVTSGGSTTTTINSPAPNPYTSGAPVSTSGVPAFYNANSFQLISAGRDRLYGLGGQWSSSAANTGSNIPLDIGILNGTTLSPLGDPQIRNREQDNLTNFTTGRLQ